MTANLTAAVASCKQVQNALRTQLRSQSADLDNLEAGNADQRAALWALHSEVASLHATQKLDSQDLIHLAGRLLALSDATGLELDATTKALFRRRGWTSARNQEAQSR